MQSLYASGRDNLLKVYFQAVSFPGPFYVGLGTGAIPEGISKDLSDVVEVTGDGYERIAVERSADVDNGWTLTNGVMVSPVLTFTNASIDAENEWTDADYAFLTLSASGLQSPNVILGAVEMDTVTIRGGRSEDIQFTFSLFS